MAVVSESRSEATPATRQVRIRFRAVLEELGSRPFDVTRRLVGRVVRSPWLFVVLAAIGPLLWARPAGDLLYGQDSNRMFLPFSFNDSPFIPYSYLYSSSFPVPDYAPTFYLDSSLWLFHSLGASPWIAQRLQMGVLSALAAAGLVVLLRAIDRARPSTGATRNWIVGVCVFAYLYNPFTLSVTFWHIEGWLPFLAFLPWIVALAVRVAFGSAVPWRLGAIVVLLGTYLSPGAISSFAVPVSLALLWGIAAVWLQRGGRPGMVRVGVTRTLLLLGVGVGIEGWSFVPFLLIPNVAYTSANYVTPENLLAVYAQASGTWAPYPVLTFTAFGWLSRTPSAYPWIGWLPVIGAAAVVFPIVALLGAERLRRSPGSLLVYAIGLTVLPFLIGAGTPLTAFNESLLGLGGPFLVLVAGYYILGPVFLLLVVAGLGETLRSSSLGIREPVPGDSSPRHSFSRKALRRPSSWVAIGICGLLVVSASPFLVGNVYQTNGPNSDAVVLPSSYSDLQSYFGAPPTGPSSYVLVLPMSAQDGVFVNLSGSHFLDTSDALASYIPYPVLQANTGPVAAALEEAFALGTPENLSGLLASMHVGAVVVSPYVNTTPATMNEAPNGAPIDWQSILASLPAQLGTGTPVGNFQVFPVHHTIPLAWSPTTLTAIHTSNASEALGFVGSVVTGPPAWAESLPGSVWVPSGAIASSWQLNPVPVVGGGANTVVPPGGNASIVTDGGVWTSVPCRSGTCSSGLADFDWSGRSLTVGGRLELSSARPTDYSGTSPNSSGEFCSVPGGSGGLNSSVRVVGPAVLRTHVTLVTPAANNWVNLELTNGSESLLLQFWQNGSAGPATISLSASSHGTPYVWHNVDLAGPVLAGQAIDLAMAWNLSTSFAEVETAKGSSSTELAFGDLGADAANPGFNPAAAPSGSVSVGTANESVAWIGGGFCLSSTSVVRSPQVRYLVATSGAAPGQKSSPTYLTTVESNGDVVLRNIRSAPGPTPQFAALGFPFDPLWTSVASAGAGLSEVPGAPLDNLVEVTGASNGTVVTFHFQTSIELGLEVSWVEVGALLLAVVLITYRQRRRTRVGAPPNTRGSPPEAMRSDRAP
ncbi:MAG: DUF3367 domain-containing protein [Thermoplasmata archaeon]|nr:DUF3367 domain-containing protein [Thermoplasmata archaeon]